MKKNIPDAFMLMASRYKNGNQVIQSETRALEMFTHAAKLGNALAYFLIGCYYQSGMVVDQDRSKALAFYEVSAKKGSVRAHKLLANGYENNDKEKSIKEVMRNKKSIKHYKVAASAGHQESMDKLMQSYKIKQLSKEDLTQTLRAYQASSNETKSKDREDAKAFMKNTR